jgi:hypothetical protein
MDGPWIGAVMTKQDLEKMRDELSKGTDGYELNGFRNGFNACLDILWPRLVGLSEAVFLADRKSEGANIDPRVFRKALKEHGVSDEKD